MSSIVFPFGATFTAHKYRPPVRLLFIVPKRRASLFIVRKNDLFRLDCRALRDQQKPHMHHPYVPIVVETFLSIHCQARRSSKQLARTYTGFHHTQFAKVLSHMSSSRQRSDSAPQSALCQKSSKSLQDIYTYIFAAKYHPMCIYCGNQNIGSFAHTYRKNEYVLRVVYKMRTNGSHQRNSGDAWQLFRKVRARRNKCLPIYRSYYIHKNRSIFFRYNN